MKPFDLNNPVHVVFGSGTFVRAGSYAMKLGKKAMIVTGLSSTKKSGVLDALIDSLKAAGIGNAVFAGVSPNPKVSEVDAASAICVKEGCDFVIGVGGGSAMDAAKGVALTAGSGGSLWDYVNLATKAGKPPVKALPIMLIPTLAATGSEGNPSAVFSNPATGNKFGMWNPDFLYPKISIVDPKLTVTVPQKATSEGIIDIIMHVLEEYLTSDVNTPLQDRFTEGVILTCIEAAERLMKDPSDIEARENVSIASTFALYGQPNAGRAGMWIVHPMEHAVSALHDEIAHGAGIAAILPAYLQFLTDKRPERVIKLGERCFNVGDDIPADMKIPVTIENLKEFLASINLKDNLKDLGIKETELEKITDACIATSGIPWPGLNRAGLLKLYKEAF